MNGEVVEADRAAQARPPGPAASLSSRLLALLAALLFVALPLLAERAAAPADSWRHTQAGHGAAVDDETMQPRTLPHRWRDDCTDCTSLWYRIDLELSDPPREAQAVYLPALGDNAAVYLNGRLLGQGGRFADPVARLGLHPLWVRAPASLWQPGENRLYVLVKAARPRAGLMPAPAIAPEQAIEGAWRLRELLAITLTQLMATAAAALALMMAVLAWYRRGEHGTVGRNDARGYRRLALAAALYAAGAFVGLVVESPLAAAGWDAVLLLTALATTLAVAALVGHLRDEPGPGGPAPAADPAARRRHLAVPGASLAGVALAAAAVAAPLEPTGAAIELVQGLLRGALALVGLALALRGWQRGQTRLLWPGAVLAIAAAADLLRLPPSALGSAPWHEALPLLPWALAALLGSAAWLLLARFVQTLNAAELLNVDLEALVHERTAALQAQFERVRELERREAITAERERLMRDMHDGVGGHLVSMLAMIEADRRRPGELAVVVRDALDDMRLMIDSLEPVDDDLNAVLAMFHDRLAPRLRGAGVRLHWDVDLLPQVAGLTPARVLHLLRILQEGVTNALRHGRAPTLWLRAEADDRGAVTITLRDDGSGFDSRGAHAGRGLKNMRRRAQEAGLELDLASAAGEGTTLRLRVGA
ncbi:MAG: hypothetical protein KF683_08080 [Rubrivivax sp.]|nr:hypothetical protein [Rubrivivax sp.]